MYTNASAATGTLAAGGILASTGFNVLSMVITGFALIAAGFALYRIAPRFSR